jgi:hypothetical protein
MLLAIGFVCEFCTYWLKLYFGVYNNGSSNVTAMYVDDVSLQVCPAP